MPPVPMYKSELGSLLNASTIFATAGKALTDPSNDRNAEGVISKGLREDSWPMMYALLVRASDLEAALTACQLYQRKGFPTRAYRNVHNSSSDLRDSSSNDSLQSS